jgi:hypothetical protein
MRSDAMKRKFVRRIEKAARQLGGLFFKGE